MTLKEIIKNNKFLNRKYIEYKWRERRVSYGNENRDKIFYVIRRTPCSIGLFSYVSTTMGHIKYAVDKGYIPVVDMQNYANTYLDEKLLGNENSWEYYFEQPMGYSLDDISHSRNVILSWAESTKKFPDYVIARDTEDYQMWYDYAQKYLKLSSRMETLIQKKQSELFKDKEIVGVLCRGTDYISNRPAQHPIQPRIEKVFERTDRMLFEHECKYVYLATEDQTIYKQFEDKYGDYLLSLDTYRYEDIGNTQINDIHLSRPNDCYLKGVEYLTTIALLARCDYLVAGCAGGTYGALLLTKGYKEKYIFFEGCYSN